MIRFAKVFCILALFMAGESLGLPVAAVLALPFVLLMKPCMARKGTAKGFAVLLIPAAMITAAVAPVRFSPLLRTEGLEYTPVWVVAGVTAAVAVFLTLGGPESLGKWAVVCLPLVAAFLLLAAALLAGKFQAAGVSVPRVWEKEPILLACEAVTILGVMPALRYKERPFRAYGTALITACGMGAAVWALYTFTLGSETAAKAPFPFVAALRVAKGGELIGRIETFFIPVSFCLTVIKMAVCLWVAAYAYKTLTGASFAVRRSGGPVAES